MNLGSDVTESFRRFQSRILAEYTKIVEQFGLLTMDATQDKEPTGSVAPRTSRCCRTGWGYRDTG